MAWSEKTETSRDVTVTDMDKEVLLGDTPTPYSNLSKEETAWDSKECEDSKDDWEQSETVTVETVTVDSNAEAVSKTSHSPSLSVPILAPLDADPSMPPYDPKKNYLSPRPQFLHYKPNPRIQHYLTGDGEGKRLEDSLFFASFSDSEVTEETQSEESQKESDDAFEGETGKQEGQLRGSELTNTEMRVTEKTNVATGEVSEPRFFKRSKVLSLLLVLLVACSSIAVTNYPITLPSPIEDASLTFSSYIPSEIYESARANLDALARNLWRWLMESLSYAEKLIFNLGDTHHRPFVQYLNLTSFYKDRYVDLLHGVAMIGNGDGQHVPEPLTEKVVVEATLLKEQETAGSEAEEESDDYSDFEGEMSHQEDVEALDDTEEEYTMDLRNQDAKAASQVQNSSDSSVFQESVIHLSASDAPEAQNPYHLSSSDQAGESTEIHNSSVMESSPPETDDSEQIQKAGSEQLERPYTPESNVDSVEFSAFQALEAPELQSLAESSLVMVDTLRQVLSRYSVLGASVVVIALVAATCFFYANKQKAHSHVAAPIHLHKPLLPKKFDISPKAGTVEQHSSQPTELDIAGESCPTEMSSLLEKSSSSKQGAKKLDEANSQEMKLRKNYKRESLASSDCSMGSLSYGSFTTYEKLPRKHGDDEVITPVRRSSRIRKPSVTSP